MKHEDFVDLYELEETYWWFVGMRDIVAAQLNGRLPESQRRILDAGCGTGIMLSWLERYSETEPVVGLDYTRDALTFCKERGHRLLAQGSVTDLPFADESFDMATCFDVLQQLPDGVDEKAMSELRRVLKPDGLLYIRVAAYQWLLSGHDRALGTLRRYTLPEFVEKLTGVGFEVEQKTYANTLLFPVVMTKRLLKDTGSDVKPLPSWLRWLNAPMTQCLRLEAQWLAGGARRLPFGLSIIAIARRTEQ
jgi:ubiquinone/menaquinone biosynthesis C-methylase UbiE